MSYSKEEIDILKNSFAKQYPEKAEIINKFKINNRMVWGRVNTEFYDLNIIGYYGWKEKEASRLEEKAIKKGIDIDEFGDYTLILQTLRNKKNEDI